MLSEARRSFLQLFPHAMFAECKLSAPHAEQLLLCAEFRDDLTYDNCTFDKIKK